MIKLILPIDRYLWDYSTDDECRVQKGSYEIIRDIRDGISVFLIKGTNIGDSEGFLITMDENHKLSDRPRLIIDNNDLKEEE